MLPELDFQCTSQEGKTVIDAKAFLLSFFLSFFLSFLFLTTTYSL